MYSLIIELDNLITVLLQVVQMFNLIFVTLYCLSISLLKVDIFHSKQLLFVIEDLVDLKGNENNNHSICRKKNECGNMHNMNSLSLLYLARSTTSNHFQYEELLALNGDGFI